MHRSDTIYASGVKFVIAIVLSNIDFLQRSGNFDDLTTSQIILAKLLLCMAETAIGPTKFPATITTTQFDSVTPIFCKMEIFQQSKHVFSSFLGNFLSRNPPYFYFWSSLHNFLKSGTHVTLAKWILSTNCKVDQTIRYRFMRPLLPIRYVTM